MTTSAARSASVTGSKSPPSDLSSAPISLRKKGRITSLETSARRSANEAKSTSFRHAIRSPRSILQDVHCVFIHSISSFDRRPPHLPVDPVRDLAQAEVRLENVGAQPQSPGDVRPQLV